MNYIEPTIGTMHDPAHLRPFDLDLAKQGHPCAYKDGDEIRRIAARKLGRDTLYVVDGWLNEDKCWWSINDYTEHCLSKWIRLAPLAVKDGKPLHVGDVIELPSIDLIRTVTEKDIGKDWIKTYWSWPLERKR